MQYNIAVSEVKTSIKKEGKFMMLNLIFLANLGDMAQKPGESDEDFVARQRRKERKARQEAEELYGNSEQKPAVQTAKKSNE